jgi:hypothetical protein
MADSAVILVDYDNVRLIRDERTAGDVANNLADVVPASVAEAKRTFGDTKEIVFRLYGGWIDEKGLHSHKAQWLTTALAWYRGRMSGVIVKPSLVTALACRTMDTLLGTVRNSRAGYQQKMVDTMMVVDAIHYARDEAVPTLLFSDDEDLLPAALAVSAMAPGVPFHWLRRRKVGSALNDGLLKRAKVTIGSVA